MWQTFIYLNWPAAARGIPNPGARFGAPGATVWETYKNVDQVFLPNGIKPSQWNQNASNSALPAYVAADAGLAETCAR